MKLILCRKCDDVFKLDTAPRSCKCGESSGRYLDNINAEYSGANAMPIGFGNRTLLAVVKFQPTEGDGRDFAAFVFPKCCRTMRKV